MKQTFPDISLLGMGDNGIPIHGASIGLNVILNYMRETSGIVHQPKWDLYLINVYTLVRNLYQKGMSEKELERCVDRDADMLMTYVHAYTCARRSVPSVVFFYAPDYGAVPATLLRPHTGNQSEIDALYTLLYKKIPDKLTELTEVHETRKFLCRVGKSIFPHKDIIDKLRHVYHGTRITGSIGTVMISHCPIDFHIYKSIPNIQLFESYTGALLNPSDFGQKLTKDVKVPFNPTTHRLFGDGTQLIPLIKGKDRKKLIQVAQDFSWAIKTEKEIGRDAISKFDNITEADLSVLKL